MILHITLLLKYIKYETQTSGYLLCIFCGYHLTVKKTLGSWIA